MPGDLHPLMPRRNLEDVDHLEDVDLGAIKADLEFLIEGLARLRKEQENLDASHIGRNHPEQHGFSCSQVLRCFTESRRKRRRSAES